MNRKPNLRNIRKLVILFGLAVLLPGVLLALIAIRAAAGEEAYLEKQYEDAFLAEIRLSAAVIRELLEEAQAELDSTTPSVGPEPRSDLLLWPNQSDLVSVPFLFRRSGRFVWPDPDDPRLTTAEFRFLEFNQAFFQDRRPERIYQRSVRKSPSKTAKTQKRRVAPPNLDLRSSKAHKDDVRNYRASSKAAGKPISQIGTPPTVYITESLKFSQIIEGKQSGIIPRLVDDRIMLVFWKKTSEDRIIGCSLNEQEIRGRVASSLQEIRTRTRILTVLDQTGAPLVAPMGKNVPDWSNPFVSREITELLPRWEVAAYLASPGIVYKRARVTSWALALLVGLLLVSLCVGGFAILRSLQAEIRLAEQKTTFVANVSHELKTPLTSIRLFAELLKEKRQPDPVKQSRYLSIMVAETERLTRLINNVLDFSRSRHGSKRYDMRNLNAVELCRELTENQRVRLEHNGFRVAFTSPVNAAPVYGDEEALKQALLNLISNAEKYSPDRKRIDVEIAVRENTVRIRVADQGCGVDPGEVSRIFGEFYRCDDSLSSRARGTGLGLTIARQIARDHGGGITCAPNTPAGSVFELSLPTRGEDV